MNILSAIFLTRAERKLIEDYKQNKKARHAKMQLQKDQDAYKAYLIKKYSMPF